MPFMLGPPWSWASLRHYTPVSHGSIEKENLRLPLVIAHDNDDDNEEEKEEEKKKKKKKKVEEDDEEGD